MHHTLYTYIKKKKKIPYKPYKEGTVPPIRAVKSGSFVMFLTHSIFFLKKLFRYSTIFSGEKLFQIGD
jgi:hypothetical protein